MENRQQQILSEIKDMMSSIRLQLEQLDAKMAELQYEVDPQSFTIESIDLDLDDSAVDEYAPIEADETETAETEIIEVEAEIEVVEEVDDLPMDYEEEDVLFQPISEPVLQLEPEPVTVHEFAQTVSSATPAMIDTMTDRQAWRTDMPGASVRDVRSAISLNDRVLFINRLFAEDPLAFQETLNAVNQMQTLEEAVEYLAGAHPSWDFNSELVYRFMMAIRRKLN